MSSYLVANNKVDNIECLIMKQMYNEYITLIMTGAINLTLLKCFIEWCFMLEIR